MPAWGIPSGNSSRHTGTECDTTRRYRKGKGGGEGGDGGGGEEEEEENVSKGSRWKRKRGKDRS